MGAGRREGFELLWGWGGVCRWSWDYCEIDLIFQKDRQRGTPASSKDLRLSRELKSRKECKDTESVALQRRQVSGWRSRRPVQVLGGRVYKKKRGMLHQGLPESLWTSPIHQGRAQCVRYQRTGLLFHDSTVLGMALPFTGYLVQPSNFIEKGIQVQRGQIPLFITSQVFR